MRALFRFLFGVATVVLLPPIAAAKLPGSRSPDSTTRTAVIAEYARLPLSFEVNRGQADPTVRFLARSQGFDLFLTPTEAVLSLRAGAPTRSAARPGEVIRMRLVGANPEPRLSGIDLLPGTSNYFIGDDPTRWHSAVPNYAGVRYSEVYPGIDLVYYGNQRLLEYDFVVAPGGDPARIVLEFAGPARLSLDTEGNLVLATATGDVVQHKPVVYQDIDGTRRMLDGRYRMRGSRQVGFEIAGRDSTRPLVIDPVLAYSTYLGGAGYDLGGAITVDAEGNAYVTGRAYVGFPTTPDAYQAANVYRDDAFVAKINATGTALVYSTYLGGTGIEGASGIAVDGSGNAYVTGFTDGGFPTTPGAYQNLYGGLSDAFVAKLNSTGTALVYSTYLGGSGNDGGGHIAVDGGGNAYVTGGTTGGFPTTSGAYQAHYGGGGDRGGGDAFVTKLNATGTALVYSTYLGGAGDDSVSGLALGSSGDVYVTGGTSGGFPTTAGAYQTTLGGGDPGGGDGFVTRLNATGTALVYSTYLGGSRTDVARGIALDASGNAWVAGDTGGSFPTTANAHQATPGGGSDGYADAFLARLDATGTALIYSTYLGGAGDETLTGIAVDGNGNVYLTGWSTGGFPTTPAVYQTTYGGAHTDAFVVKFADTAPSNADLASLLLSHGTLDPAFASGTTTYTASVGNATTSITVTPTAADATATILVNGTIVTSGSASGAIALAVGSNTITMQVTAQDGVTIRTYVVSVTRAAAARLVNLSARARVLTGDSVLIGGFVIGGSTPKVVVARARGPSLVAFGIAGALADPSLRLFSGQTMIAGNDDWQSAANAGSILSSGLAPTDARESAIHTTLDPGAYTAIVSGTGNSTGVGIVEIFEVDHPETPLVNISARGQVLTGDDVMIGGLIIQGDGPQTVVIRARGPSLRAFGIIDALENPVLQLYSGQTLVASNDDWGGAPNAAQIMASGLAPGDARESAILITLSPGAYTAITRGAGGGLGVGIVEVFAQ